MPQICAAELRLPPIIVRVRRIGASPDNPQIAVYPPSRYRSRASTGVERIGKRTRCDPGRNQIREVCGQPADSRVSVNGLEELGGMVAHISALDYGVGHNFPLKPE